jgi:hypothetical protein
MGRGAAFAQDAVFERELRRSWGTEGSSKKEAGGRDRGRRWS